MSIVQMGRRLLLAGLLVSLLTLGSFYTSTMVETAFACQHSGGGGGC